MNGASRLGKGGSIAVYHGLAAWYLARAGVDRESRDGGDGVLGNVAEKYADLEGTVFPCLTLSYCFVLLTGIGGRLTDDLGRQVHLT